MGPRWSTQQQALAREMMRAFQEAGWQVLEAPRAGTHEADFTVRRGPHKFNVEFKYVAEPRRDRAIPLLAQAILETTRVSGHHGRGKPLVILGAPRITEALAESVRRYAEEHAPGLAVGVLDLEHFREFWGAGLESMNSPRLDTPWPGRMKAPDRPNPFSDLNQWMLKVLLATSVEDRYLRAPREKIEGPTHLANIAGVSAMSASRLIRILDRDGHLDTSGRQLRVVRTVELMDRWSAACKEPARELPMRWILRADLRKRLREAAGSVPRNEADAINSRDDSQRPTERRLCLGLFAAAEELGIGFVSGVTPHLYVESIDAEIADRLGLIPSEGDGRVDVVVRVPRYPESLFRGMVHPKGIPAADAIQVWLDVRNHPARGEKQAEEVQRRVLSAIFRSRS